MNELAKGTGWELVQDTTGKLTLRLHSECGVVELAQGAGAGFVFSALTDVGRIYNDLKAQGPLSISSEREAQQTYALLKPYLHDMWVESLAVNPVSLEAYYQHRGSKLSLSYAVLEAAIVVWHAHQHLEAACRNQIEDDGAEDGPLTIEFDTALRARDTETAEELREWDRRCTVRERSPLYPYGWDGSAYPDDSDGLNTFYSGVER